MLKVMVSKDTRSLLLIKSHHLQGAYNALRGPSQSITTQSYSVTMNLTRWLRERKIQKRWWES